MGREESIGGDVGAGAGAPAGHGAGAGNGAGGAAGEDGATIDWALLRTEAAKAAGRAYAPYSRLAVGAAGLADGLAENRRIVTGCNVENASYGLTLCAECGLVSALHAQGGRRLLAVSIVAGDGRPLAPCGRCRQLLYEAGGAGLLVDQGAGASPVRLGSLLPDAFGERQLEERRGGGPE